MKIVIAIDSFKGSISSAEAGSAISKGIRKAIPSADVTVCPIADGGEGTVEALTLGLSGKMQSVEVTGPIGDKVTASYGIAGNTAIIEMASASGLPLVPKEKRNPLYATTYGVGEIISDAIKKGCRNFIIGIGGSATNDGGAGMLQALGFELLNGNDEQVKLGAIGLKELCKIKCDKAFPELKECTFNIACDVTNPLCGENGCSAIFAKQKGATPEAIAEMDTWLDNYSTLAGYDKNTPGAGAAGGLGYAFLAFLNGRLERGIDLIIKETKLEETLADADFVITGEGRLDSQTVMGKAPSGIACLAKKYGIPVIAFSGCVTPDAVKCNDYGIDAFFPILRNVSTLDEALDTDNARANLSSCVEQVFRLINTVRSKK